MSKIDPSLYLSNQTKTRTPSPEMGKDAFLKILMTQLQNQDPTSPMDDKEFISQMAQFSTLEQMTNMTESINALVQSQLISPVVQYSHMIGKTVTYPNYNEETGVNEGTKQSKVVAVSQQDGWAVLELENGEKIYADAILQVSDQEIADKDTSDEKQDES
ncbi:flagellar hook assembly protein FlgD [Virgibacillus sp. 179-BFC.A HS]|uniref:Flagellar hook assembly protein FlgD n=1 Tax=Tigheibacillus jepli TaxID=3035914 RepID=A0ABU5CIV3_9BACI|nr:flagellar hook assembly protein FlgD [Virgibacillus sp. 179-BFC.A HS]MDY0405881.1 flagellar hook assembly protein FlgD [Virgibacillus sp. 179-BFC.A HS]